MGKNKDYWNRAIKPTYISCTDENFQVCKLDNTYTQKPLIYQTSFIMRIITNYLLIGLCAITFCLLVSIDAAITKDSGFKGDKNN